MAERTGGQAVVDALESEGVQDVFGLIGSAGMEIFDALHASSRIRFVSSSVRARVDPPAPYVIETNDGWSGRSAATVAKSCCMVGTRSREISSITPRTAKAGAGSLATGKDSPVRLDSSISRLSAASRRQSPTTTSPRSTPGSCWTSRRSTRPPPST